MYAPLFTKSNYSFLEGASHPEELVARADELGLKALALTDRDGFYGVVRAFEESRTRNVRVIVGSQLSVDDGSSIVCLAQTKRGYANLSALITRGRRRCEKGRSQVSWQEIAAHSEDVIALWGGRESLLTQRDCPQEVVHLLLEAFEDRLYALLTRHFDAEEDARRALLLARAERYGLLPVAAVEVLYHDQARRPLQDVLTCIKHGTCLSDASPLLRPNAAHQLCDLEEFSTRFSPWPAALARTREVAERCPFSMAEIRYHYPQGKLPEGHTADSWLRELTLRGATTRYGAAIPEPVQDLLVKEFSVIAELGYAGYFLTMKEIVDFCEERAILCQGRGSAANSVVCFCLGITAVDPVKMDLLFERFLSKERAEPPDIDLDIAHQRREEVIQHVYERFGRERAAMVANVIRYRPRSAVRDVGKALGLSPALVDRLARQLSHRGGLDEEVFTQTELDPTTPKHQLLQALTNEILEFPRHLSIHPGGFLLAQERVSDLVPVENATMENRTVIQWDKYDVEALGLFKLDLLGLGALTMLDEAFRLLKTHQNIDLEMATIPADDEATFDMICRAETVGVFQIESRAQMAMLPRMRPRKYYDLVVQISIIRPGPITGDMVHPYLQRRQGKQPVLYAHPALEPVLKKTLGIPLFQEQVIRLAMVAADYSPGEADQLRRDMAAWRKEGRIERHRERLISRMCDKGIEEEFAQRIFQQILGFADYGFPESHAASFALIAYATAYMRCHHPVVFTCALLNAQPMGFYSPATIINEARRRKIEARPVDVARSRWDCTLEASEGTASSPFAHALRMGLRYVKGLRKESAERILTARGERPFESIKDFTTRTRLPSDDQRRLAEAGALQSFQPDRRRALWQLAGVQHDLASPLSLPLTEEQEELVPAFRALSRLETINWDQRTTYHSTLGHPLGPLRPALHQMGLPTAIELTELPDGSFADFAALVICRQRPQTASGMVFMTLEDESGLANVVVYPQIFERYGVLIRTACFLGISGQVQNQEGVTHLVAQHIWTPRLSALTERVRSRDFH